MAKIPVMEYIKSLRLRGISYEEAREHIIQLVKRDDEKPNLYLQLEILAHIYLGEKCQLANRKYYRQGFKRAHSKRDWENKKAQYGYRCVYCGRKSVKLTKDHIVPYIKGGPDTIDNIVPACLLCNIKKRDYPLETFKSGIMLKML